MQLIADGPDIPLAVLDAHARGQLAFFCGAGVSMRAGLPLFRGLVERVYQELGTAPVNAEQTESDARNFDRVLNLLEGRFSRAPVRRAVIRTLATPMGAALQTHHAIIDLARDRNSRLQLVTTNFDLLFQAAGAAASAVYSGPELPIPKRPRWNGLVHLHGRIREDDPDGERLVLTSADFGLAYLMERWASRFVSELFNNFTVIFIGYSVDDPVMRYLVDALAAERQRSVSIGEQRIRDVFAFASYAPGARDDIDRAWRAKSIVPILYDDREDHSLLHSTLEAWASNWRGGLESKIGHVREKGPNDPATLPPSEVSLFRWAVSDESGVPAGALSDEANLASLKWLPEIEAVLSAGLSPSSAGLSPLVDDGEKTLAAALDPVRFGVARWLAKNVAEADLVRWVVEKGGQLHPQFADLIDRELDTAVAVPDALRTVWRALINQNGLAFREPPSYRVIAKTQRLRTAPWSSALRLEFLAEFSPCMKIAPQHFPYPPAGDPALVRIAEVLSADCEIRAGDERNEIVGALRARGDYRNVAMDLAFDFTGLLRNALDLQASFDKASADSDLGYIQHPSITAHAQNAHHHGWTTLIDLVRDSFDIAVHDRPSLARDLVRLWVSIRYPTFRRLVLYAAAAGVTP
jgi:hypothetical protein